MQTDYFTGPTVVHCHRLMHEDNGMMVTVNFTGVEGTRYLPAYGNMTEDNTSLIDPTCYKGLEVKPANFTGTRVGKCAPASPPPSQPTPPPTPPPLPSSPSSSPPCVDTYKKKCKKKKCKKYSDKKKLKCKKTCDVCDGLPPSPPPSPPLPPSLPACEDNNIPGLGSYWCKLNTHYATESASERFCNDEKYKVKCKKTCGLCD